MKTADISSIRDALGAIFAMSPQRARWVLANIVLCELITLDEFRSVMRIGEMRPPDEEEMAWARESAAKLGLN